MPAQKVVAASGLRWGCQDVLSGGPDFDRAGVELGYALLGSDPYVRGDW